ncbi:MAG: (d)CMP kinase, partial [Ilumatobacteraceae bacterium]
STIARALAASLGWDYLDTGAMYRAVTSTALRRGLDPGDEPSLGALSRSMALEMVEGRVVADGVDVTTDIRGDQVTAAVSAVASLSEVRAEMRRRQRQWGEQRRGGVVEGRDIGTVVFPDAVAKVYLTASPRVRAERRVRETGGDVEVIAAAIVARDLQDSTRADSPLAESSDAVIVDTSDRTVDEVVAELVALVEERLP